MGKKRDESKIQKAIEYFQQRLSEDPNISFNRLYYDEIKGIKDWSFKRQDMQKVFREVSGRAKKVSDEEAIKYSPVKADPIKITGTRQFQLRRYSAEAEIYLAGRKKPIYRTLVMDRLPRNKKKLIEKFYDEFTEEINDSVEFYNSLYNTDIEDLDRNEGHLRIKKIKIANVYKRVI